MINIFVMPKYIINGKDALKNSKYYLKKLGKKALIITDNTIIKLGTIKKLEDILKEINIEYCIFDGIMGEPTDIMVEEGFYKYKKNNCDFLIALGGGSVIDAMKAIGIIATKNEKISNFNGKIIDIKLPNLVAIPTTAGTGSEVTKFTIINDTQNNIKMLLKGESLIPTLAIIDPIFTLTTPKFVTATTGIDALTHAIEAYTSKLSNPLSDIFALSAIKKLYENLLKVYNDGNNIKSREIISLAATEAGIAFNNSSVTIIHGMSRPIGALFHIPHGLSNAILLETCLKFIKLEASDKLKDLAKLIGEYKEGMTEIEAADIFIEKITNLLKKLEIPTLKALKIDKDKFIKNIDKMTEDALNSGSPSNTRKVVTEEDIKIIYKSLWNED